MANTNPSDRSRSDLLRSYERAAADGTHAGAWRALAEALADKASKTVDVDLARSLFARADDCVHRANRAERLEVTP